MKLTIEQKTNSSLVVAIIAIVLSIIALTLGGTKVAETGPDAFYLSQAKEAGVRKSTFEKCIASPEIASRIDEETAEAARIGGQGTPFNVIATPFSLDYDCF